MLKNYLKTAIRSLLKHKVFSLINILGLSIGIGIATLLGRYIQEEMSYDQFYEQKSSFFRVYQESKINGRERTGITGSGLLAPTLASTFPEIALAGRTHRVGQPVIEYEGKQFIENRLAYADNSFLELLELVFTEGNPKNALSDPTGFVITEDLAIKLFGKSTDLVGTGLKVGDQLVQVTGVIENLPKNSHYSPKSGFLSNAAMGTFSWNRVGHVTYLRIKEGIAPSVVEERLVGFVEQNILPTLPEGSEFKMGIYPVSDIWLEGGNAQQSGGSKATLYSFGLIAFFILLLAAINYMNLATARSLARAREIGMRKVIGARRGHVMGQFLTESVLLSALAVLLGGFLAEMCTGLFNDLTGKNLEVGFVQNPALLLTLLGFGLAVGLLSGLYPAIFLSAFKPLRVLKSSGKASKTNQNIRRFLVSLQFVISIGLIISTLVVQRQIQYLQNKDLGYNTEQVLAIRLAKADTSEIVKSAFMQLPNVSAVTATNLLPATGDSGATFTIQDDNGEQHRDIVSMASIDYDYLSTMELSLITGRNFDRALATDDMGIIINETLQKKYGWQDPIGKTISMKMQEEVPASVFTVVGVVEDFNMLSLYEPVKPFAFFLKPQFDWGPQYLLTKLNVADVNETVEELKTVYQEIEKDRPFSSLFIDDYFARVYESETKKAQVYLTFSTITIVIACIGLFGLATFVLSQKIKEISIRKILGAGIKDIVQMVSREFVIIILISSLIASPVAYYFLQDWLNSFEYRTSFGLDSIFIGSAIALLLSLATITFQALRIARVNPAQTLKQD